MEHHGTTESSDVRILRRIATWAPLHVRGGPSRRLRHVLGLSCCRGLRVRFDRSRVKGWWAYGEMVYGLWWFWMVLDGFGWFMGSISLHPQHRGIGEREPVVKQGDGVFDVSMGLIKARSIFRIRVL